MTRGVRRASSTLRLSGERVSKAVARNRLSISTPASMLRLFGSMTMRTSSVLSSRMSPSSGSFFSSSSAATCSISFPLATW